MESVCLRVSALLGLTEGGYRGERRVSKVWAGTIVARARDGPPGRKRPWARDGWVSGQGAHRDGEGAKGREEQGSGWRSEGPRPGLG